MAILTNSGRVATATAVKSQEIHLAWGSGSEQWDILADPGNIADTTLVSEIGRRRAAYVAYCLPDAAGAIQVPDGRFVESATPTKHLYMRFSFDFDDAPAASIRELGVFVGTKVLGSIPPGQMYFVPSELADPGMLLMLEHIQRFDRSPSVRQSFEFVVNF